jgi:pSer/pThr/pTyr-binding forkhead associated (FHA) protein
MKAELIPLSPLEQHEPVLLTEFPIVVGRAVHAELQVVDRWISRSHCEIDEIDGTLVVRDLESSNGTFANGSAVSSSPLLPDDLLRIGISTFKVSYKRTTSKAPPPVVYANTPVLAGGGVEP